MQHSFLDRLELALLLLLSLGGTAALMRILLVDPAPGFFDGSLRRVAQRMLGPSDRLSRGRRTVKDAARAMWPARWWVLPILAVAALSLPISVRWGPLAASKESTSYLDTIWVVVGASLGLSVAMVAFAFQAFMTSGRRVHGGTLLEFADETRLLDTIRLGVLSLLVTGAVLLKIGHDAPFGWAATWAIFLSGLTLLAVPYVVRRVVVSLDERQLLLMRSRRLKATVLRAMRHQLTQQAAEVVVQQTRMPISRSLITPAGAVAVGARKAGEVRDVKLGRLARQIQRLSRDLKCELALGLGDQVEVGRPLFWLRGPLAEHPPRWIHRCVVVSSDPERRPDRELLDQLSSLHRRALDAAREGQYEQWREVADGYELVLLALPPASATFDVPFSGAVAAPGFFGLGPLQRIQRYLFDELRAAVSSDQSELVDAISYFPAHIAARAIKIGAPVIATTMLALYPSMYILAQRGST